MKHENYIKTQVYRMMTENTGRHFLDSGGAYGRHWERNQQLTIDDFDRRPEQTHEVTLYYDDDGNVKYADCMVTTDLWHWLVGANLDYDDKCVEFNALIEQSDPWDDDLGFVTSKCARLLERWNPEYGELYNTYNDDCTLNQCILYRWVTIDDEKYVLLSVHGGCDVRGGYTASRLFRLDTFNYDWLYNETLNRTPDRDQVHDDLEMYDLEFHLTRYLPGGKHIIPNARACDLQDFIHDDIFDNL